MILLFGNCQLQRMSFILRVNNIECDYIANTENVDEDYDGDIALEAVSKASLVIAQPVFNESSPINYKRIAKIAKEVVFVPYVYVDGIFCLDSTSIGSPIMLGSASLEGYLNGDFNTMLSDFLVGNIDFNNSARLDHSLSEFVSRERSADAIVISDVVIEYHKRRELLLSHNHPEKWLMNIMAERLFKALSWPYRSYDTLLHHHRVEYLFSKGETVLSPYDVDRLGLKYQSDDQWWTIGQRLLTRFWHHRQSQSHVPTQRMTAMG